MMKRIMTLVTVLIAAFFLTGCREESLDDVLEKIKESNSFTLTTQMDLGLGIVSENVQMVDGDISYFMNRLTGNAEGMEEYYIVNESDGRYLWMVPPHAQDGNWVRQKLPDGDLDDEPEVDPLDMESAWFEKDSDGFYELKDEYFDKIMEDASEIELVSLKINVNDGELFMTMEVIQPNGAFRKVDIAVINIGTTEITDIPFPYDRD